MIIEGGLAAAVGVAVALACVVLILSVALAKMSSDNRKNNDIMKELLDTEKGTKHQGHSLAVPDQAKPLRRLSLARLASPTASVQQESVQPKHDTNSNNWTGHLDSFFHRGVPRVDPENENVLGRLSFSVSFDREGQELQIHVIEAEGLPALDVCGSSDPYVRVSLFPCPNCPVKHTRVHRRTLSPKFSQTLNFPGYTMAKLEEMNLCMQVMDYDRFARDDPIGEILLPLKGVKLDSSPVYWKNLQKPTAKCMDNSDPETDEKGEIMLSLCYQPQKSKLSVAVIRAKDLPAKDITGTSDPYVKVWLIEQGSKVEKRKTSVKPHTLQPAFNESFTFNITPEKVETDIQMAITVMDYDMLSSNDEMGHIIIGRKGSESGQKHWKEMVSKPGTPVIMWHRLSPKW